MEVVALSKYRQVGGRLGAYIRANNPSTQQIQGLLADLLADDELLPTMREVVSRPGFSAVKALAGSGDGGVQRDALLQELSARFLPAVVERVGQLINGILDLPAGSYDEDSKIVEADKAKRSRISFSLPGNPENNLKSLFKLNSKHSGGLNASGPTRGQPSPKQSSQRWNPLFPPLIGTICGLALLTGTTGFYLLRNGDISNTGKTGPRLDSKPSRQATCTEAIANVGRAFQDQHGADLRNVLVDNLPDYYSKYYDNIPVQNARAISFDFERDIKTTDTGGQELVDRPKNLSLLDNPRALQEASATIATSCPDIVMATYGYFPSDAGWPQYFRMPDGSMKPAVYLPCGRGGSKNSKIPWGYTVAC